MKSRHGQRHAEVGEPKVAVDELAVAVACVFIPHFPLRVEILRHPELDGLPLALTDLSTGNRRAILEASPEAQEHGIRIGMSLRDAVNTCPQAVILTADPVHYANAFADLTRALGAVSPGIQPGEQGSVYVDIRGLGRLYGGLEGIAAALLAAVPAILRPRLGMASNKFTAWVAAHKARPGGYHTVPGAFGKAFLARCPVRLLPVGPDVWGRLERFGLYELGDVARLPAGKLQAQFGPTGRRIWELAQGRDGEQLIPQPYEERVVERLTLPAPSVQLETVLEAVKRLSIAVFARPVMRGRGARQARVRLLLEGNRSWERTFALKGTVSEPHLLAWLLRDRLTAVTLDGMVEELVLELSGLSGVAARQVQLFPTGPRQRQEDNVREAVRQLQQRYGTTPVYRAMRVEPWSRLPERRWALFGYES